MLLIGNASEGTCLRIGTDEVAVKFVQKYFFFLFCIIHATPFYPRYLNLLQFRIPKIKSSNIGWWSMLVFGSVKDFKSFLYSCSPATDYNLFFIFLSSLAFWSHWYYLYSLPLFFPLPYLPPSNPLLPSLLSSSLLPPSLRSSLPPFFFFPPGNASNHLSNTVPFQISGFSLTPTSFLSSSLYFLFYLFIDFFTYRKGNSSQFLVTLLASFL